MLSIGRLHEVASSVVHLQHLQLLPVDGQHRPVRVLDLVVIHGGAGSGLFGGYCWNFRKGDKDVDGIFECLW